MLHYAVFILTNLVDELELKIRKEHFSAQKSTITSAARVRAAE